MPHVSLSSTLISSFFAPQSCHWPPFRFWDNLPTWQPHVLCIYASWLIPSLSSNNHHSRAQVCPHSCLLLSIPDQLLYTFSALLIGPLALWLGPTFLFPELPFSSMLCSSGTFCSMWAGWLQLHRLACCTWSLHFRYSVRAEGSWAYGWNRVARAWEMSQAYEVFRGDLYVPHFKTRLIRELRPKV